MSDDDAIAQYVAVKNTATPQELFTALYTDLRLTALRQLRRNVPTTLSPTTLLHETFLSLSSQASAAFDGKAHFMTYAARAMRSLIIDHLRNRSAQKRGGEYDIISLPTDLPFATMHDGAKQDGDIEALSEALEALATVDPRLAECVDLNFFCGFSFAEIAEMWQVSERTIKRDWNKARVLLRRLIIDNNGTRQVVS